MDEILNKGPIRFLNKYITNHDKRTNLETIATQFSNIDKWIANEDINNKLFNDFWIKKNISTRKQLFFERKTYPSITCSTCNSLEPYTWIHVLLNCKQHHIHAFRIKRHNKAVWALKKLIISLNKSKCFILMNVGTFEDNPLENIVPPLLLSCTCKHKRCHCNTRFKPDILCMKGLLYKFEPPTNHNVNVTVQFIQFTYRNDKFSPETIAAKTKKYQPLIDDLTNNGWKINQPIVIIVGARVITHIPSIKSLEEKLNIPRNAIKHTYKK